MKKLLLTFLACGFVLIVGCTEPQQQTQSQTLQITDQPAVRAPDPAPTHIVTADTVYYMSGPQQARPPEGIFKAGTKVTLIQNAGSYCVVRSASGIRAYVSTDSLQLIEN